MDMARLKHVAPARPDIGRQKSIDDPMPEKSSAHRASGVPRAKPRRRRSLGLAQPEAGMRVRGIEVFQCVQELTHSVPLIAGKVTIVRVYLDPASVMQSGQL